MIVVGVLALVALHADLNALRQGIDRRVDGLLLVTSDKRLVTSERREFKDGETWGEVVKRFPSDRYLVKEWGRRSMIVIDLKTGPLGQLLKQLDTTKTLLEKVSRNGAVDASQLKHENFEAMYMGATVSPNDKPEGLLGFLSKTNFTVRNAGRSKTIQLFTDPEKMWKTYGEIDSQPFRVRKAQGGNGATGKASDSVESDQTEMPFLGIAPANYADGFMQAGKLVSEIEIQAKRDLEAITADLLQKRLGYAGKQLPADELPLEQLPDSVRTELEKMFSRSWKSLGFQDESEAEQFLKGSTGVKMSTELGAFFCVEPGDRAKQKPSAHGSFMFLRVPGAYFP